MGGKNPAIVMPSADLDKASDGVMRSAFGAQGQKCSACSRVLVHRDVRDRFVDALVAKTKQLRVGNPLDRDVYLGPVINEAAVRTFETAVTRATADGGGCSPEAAASPASRSGTATSSSPPSSTA